MNSLKLFAKNIKIYRTKNGYSQEKLADLSQLHRTYISSVERSQRNITLENAEKIANALNIPLYKLLLPLEEDVHE
ncbi:helix-turn-helix transcriptional regulator (plasmid) [Arthrobacter citreus]|uniref:C.AciIP n=1 Tax=Arthrobacter citreus TaxID=1670 RepID=E3VX91_9MICC|nr:C.AciIP [Arthrobacter citreus]QKE76208.1 helix-turn-helix transcriptional regulator [Arthrobacter citreus]